MDWQLVYKTDNTITANIIKGMLMENDVDAVIMNKQDSAYKVLGYLEIMVPTHQWEKAKDLLNAHGENL